jgi:hypothetical protein
MSDEETTLTSIENGEDKYKAMLPRGADRQNLRQISPFVVEKIKKKVYPVLELPGRCNTLWGSDVILDLVLKAGIRNACLEDTVTSVNLLNPKMVLGSPFPSAPTSDTVFNRIKKVTTDEWIRRFDSANRRLLETARKARTFMGLVDLAVDIHDIPYYGNKNTRGVVGTQRKLGTNYAFRYMTVCVTAQREKYTFSAAPMTELSSKEKVLRLLLVKALQYIGGKVGCVYIDRGFCNVPCISVFIDSRMKFLMPAVKNSKIKKIIRETKEFPAVIPYTMRKGKKSVTFTLVLLEEPEKKSKRIKQKKREILAFATNLPVDVKDAEKLFDLYGNRWTVETSYRMLGEVRTKTTCKVYSVRWFFVLFGLLVRNGYYLFNEVVKEFGHITQILFSEMFITAVIGSEWG